ncbi:P-loop containing nucleoside triphosphate hydrolase protein [Xylariales sp. AK1849]|nr:P-loop containing nucleoside triphosphate hydrolase protein [Xylariales sp. AK1849]
MQRCHGDDSFGPSLGSGSNCHNFDFTLLFEDCIFSLIPSVLVTIAASYRIYELIVFQISLIAVWSRDYGGRTRLTVPAGTLALLATLALIGLTEFEHTRVVRPSLVIQTYLFFTSVVDVARVRTQWLLSGNRLVASLVTITLALKIGLLVLESLEKWRFSNRAEAEIPPLERCGIFGRSLMLWLNPLFKLGYNQDLTTNDLFPLDEDLNGEILTNRLIQRWNNTDKSRKHCLTIAVVLTFVPESLVAWLPRAFNIGFMVTQPYLVQTTLEYIMDHDRLPVSYGYGLIGAYGIVYIGVAVSNQLFSFLTFRLMVKLRGSLVGLLYRDMLTIRAESKNSSSALTLMSTDVDRITMTARYMIDIVPNLAQIALAMWILSLQLGAACVAPFIVALLCAGGTAIMAKMLPPRQRQWISAIQKRVGITSDILGEMKGIKMTGISDPITKQIQGLRDFELAESRKFRKLQIMLVTMNTVPMLSMSAVTFTVFAIVAKVSGSGTLGITQAFTSLSLLSVLVVPVGILVVSWSSIIQSMACLDRIQDFLLLEKRTDYRLTDPHPNPPSRHSFLHENEEKLENPLIDARDASFGWDKDEGKVVLKNVSIEILPSTFNLLVGPVASGKSTLLKSFLGETYLYSGSISFGNIEEVAYCDQDAWILNQSIRDNIVGFSQFSEDFYNRVIVACQLEEDLGHLPAGDLSKVGSQGISLSGGQKQRVALARAVYSRKKIVIMDDTMKGLDADTSNKCFNALFGKSGLLRKDGITVIMATHNAQWFQFADRLIVLKDGHIASVGSFESLKDLDDYVKSLQASYSHNGEVEEENDGRLNTESSDTPPESSQDIRLSDKAEVEPKSSSSPVRQKPAKGRGNRNSSLSYYLKSLMSMSFLIFCSTMVLQTAFRILQPLWLKFWTAANASNPNEDPGKWVGVYVLFSVLNLAGMTLQFSIFLLTIVPRSAKALHWSILKVAMSSPMSYFVSTDIGEIVNRFSQDMTLIDFPLPVSLMMTSEQFIGAVGELVLTCVSSGYLAVAIPFLFLALFYIQKYYLRTSRQLRLLELEAKSPLYSFFISSFAGLTTIRAFSWSSESYEEHIQRLNTSQRPFYLLYCVQRWLMLVLQLTVAGLCVLLIGISVAIRDKIDAGFLGVALTSVTNFGLTLTQLIQTWTELETSLGAITRIREFIGDTPQESDGADYPPDNWPAKGAVSISELSGMYGTRTVLDRVSLEIKPGEKVAVCGRSGSGKSTLLSLLLRMYEPTAGTITIDGVDTSTLKLNALREAMVTLPQDPLLLAGTVRYSLDPASRAGDDEMLVALEKTGLRDVIEDKGGLDADFNTDWLSAGQKQLFCLARAMLRPSRILLLDEATSSLDHQTDELIQTLIRKEFAGWTLVVVAHRLRTIADFDKVLVLQDGKVAEFDSPKTLLEKGGLFKSLWELQE